MAQETFAVQVLPRYPLSRGAGVGRCATGPHLRAARCGLRRGSAADRRGAGPLPGRALPTRHGSVSYRPAGGGNCRLSAMRGPGLDRSPRPLPTGGTTGRCRALRRGGNLVLNAAEGRWAWGPQCRWWWRARSWRPGRRWPVEFVIGLQK